MIISVQFLRSAVQSSQPPFNLHIVRPTLHGQPIYLCHSPHDSILARGFIQLANSEDWHIQADLQKSHLPDQPNSGEMAKIQQEILKHDYFVFLATVKSMASPWAPWQIGCVTAKKSADSILVVPTTGEPGKQGGEFLRAYRHIDLDARNRLQVVEPGLSGQGKPVRVLSKESRLTLVQGHRAQS
jgi:hypothetical protein